jgi:hypothetical protein
MKSVSFVIASAVLLPAFAMASSGGPPNAHTGAPGENNCTACHATNPLNSGDGVFSLSGPLVWVPGETYPITVTLSDPGQSRWGFEATQLGQGLFSEAESTLQISSGGGNQYIKHTSSGTQDNTPDGPVSWTFDWTAPSGVDLPLAITFYAAGNAANSNDGNTGDFIYTTSFTTDQDLTSVEAPGVLPNDLQLANYPNPFNPTTEISFRLARSGPVELSVYNLRGEKVSTLLNRSMPAGEGRVQWNGASDRGVAQPSGVYFVRLENAGHSTIHRMLLVK